MIVMFHLRGRKVYGCSGGVQCVMCLICVQQGLLDGWSVICSNRIDYFIFNLFQTAYSQGDNSLSLGSPVFLFVVFTSCPHTKTYTINFWSIGPLIQRNNKTVYDWKVEQTALLQVIDRVSIYQWFTKQGIAKLVPKMLQGKYLT